MAHCRVLLCNINKKSGCQDGGFLSISNKDLVTFHFSLAIYRHSGIFCWNPANVPGNPVHISVLYHSAQKTFHAKTEGRPMGLLQNVPPE